MCGVVVWVKAAWGKAVAELGVAILFLVRTATVNQLAASYCYIETQYSSVIEATLTLQ
jgi:hypothetical protein